MTMIHKIAWTAAMMLFLLAQFISGYVIFASHQEKIELLQEKEGRYFVDAAGRCMEGIQKTHSEDKSGICDDIFFPGVYAGRRGFL